MKLLDNISFRMKVILSVLAIVIGINVLFFAVFKPKISSMVRTKTRLEALVAEIDREVRKETGFVVPSAEEQKEWLGIESELRRRIPENMELPRVLESIATLAKGVGIEDLTMSSLPQDADENAWGEQVVQIGDKKFSLSSEDDASKGTNPLGNLELEHATINMTFHSEYKALAEFLESLCGLPRFVLITKLDIERELPRISVSMSVRVFSLAETQTPVQTVASN